MNQQSSSQVFDLNISVIDTNDIVALCKQHYPRSEISASGHPLPFPAEVNDGKLDTFLGIDKGRSFADGVVDTLAVFEVARQRGSLDDAAIKTLISKNV